VAFRWVREPTTADDFIPVGLLQPERSSCQSYALSFFSSIDAARTKWLSLAKRLDAPNRFGTHVARLDLLPSDGVTSDAGRDGHFSLYEYSGVSLHGRVGGAVVIDDRQRKVYVSSPAIPMAADSGDAGGQNA
jgi:hypothetical protein